MNYLISSVQGIGKRDEQQDSYGIEVVQKNELFIHNALLAIVADGIGGLEVGKEVSELAVSTMKKAFRLFKPEIEVSKQLNNAVMATNAFLYEKYHEKGGTTLVSCIIENNRLYYSGVGDSSAVLMRDGFLHEINQPQNVLYDDYRAELFLGKTDPSTANRDPHGRALTSFLGSEEIREIDYLRNPLVLIDGDVLMICSDGVSSFLDESEILTCMNQREPEMVCEKIVDYLTNENSPNQDNYTAIIIQCHTS